MRRPEKNQIIAAGITILATLLLLLGLYFGTLSYDRGALAAASVPEPGMEEDEDYFLDPPLVIGDEDVSDMNTDEPAASPLGLPDPAPEDNERLVVKGENPEPVKTQEKLVTQKQPSPLSSKETSKTEEKESKVTSQMSKNFSPKNGKADGKQDATGSGGKGSGVSGNVRGRKFFGCPLPVVSLKKTVTVVISIRVDEDGKVIEASVKSRGGASQENVDKCLASAKKARWSKKAGAAPVSGSLTFTLVPKI